MVSHQENVSTFALLVDKLREMGEPELKLLYLKIFKLELTKDWENLTKECNFDKISDDDIVTAIQKQRYFNE